MSKKAKTEEETDEKIKRDFSIHLEELLKEQGIRKKDLAEKIFTTPQTISKACQGIRLTRSTAESIVKEFPEYYIGWILGYPNSPKYKKDFDKILLDKAEKHRKAQEKDEDFFDIIARLAGDVGFESYYNGSAMIVEPTKELEGKGYKPVILSFSNGMLLNLQEDVLECMKCLFTIILKRGQNKNGIDKTDDD